MRKRNWLASFTAALALLTLTSGCATGAHGTRGLPEKPTLEYGWSEPRVEVLGGKEEEVRCMTVDDRRALYHYIYLLEFEAGR